MDSTYGADGTVTFDEIDNLRSSEYMRQAAPVMYRSVDHVPGTTQA